MAKKLHLVNESEIERLPVLKITTFKDMPDQDKKKLPSYIKIKDIGRVFYTVPMFNPCNVGKKDLIFELLSETGKSEEVTTEFNIVKLDGIKKIEKFHTLTAHVYNSIEPDFSEIGLVNLDEKYENRIVS